MNFPGSLGSYNIQFQSAIVTAAMKPSTPRKPEVATLLPLLPFDVDVGADEVLVAVALEHEIFDGIVKLFESVRSEHS